MAEGRRDENGGELFEGRGAPFAQVARLEAVEGDRPLVLKVLEPAIDDGADKLVLAAEMIVDGGDVDARPVGDMADGGALNAMGCKQGFGNIKNAVVRSSGRLDRLERSIRSVHGREILQRFRGICQSAGPGRAQFTFRPRGPNHEDRDKGGYPWPLPMKA